MDWGFLESADEAGTEATRARRTRPRAAAKRNRDESPVFTVPDNCPLTASCRNRVTPDWVVGPRSDRERLEQRGVDSQGVVRGFSAGGREGKAERERWMKSDGADGLLVYSTLRPIVLSRNK